ISIPPHGQLGGAVSNRSHHHLYRLDRFANPPRYWRLIFIRGPRGVWIQQPLLPRRAGSVTDGVVACSATAAKRRRAGVLVGLAQTVRRVARCSHKNNLNNESTNENIH